MDDYYFYLNNPDIYTLYKLIINGKKYRKLKLVLDKHIRDYRDDILYMIDFFHKSEVNNNLYAEFENRSIDTILSYCYNYVQNVYSS